MWILKKQNNNDIIQGHINAILPYRVLLYVFNIDFGFKTAELEM